MGVEVASRPPAVVDPGDPRPGFRNRFAARSGRAKPVLPASAKERGSRSACLTMAYKLMGSAAAGWRALHGSKLGTFSLPVPGLVDNADTLDVQVSPVSRRKMLEEH